MVVVVWHVGYICAADCTRVVAVEMSQAEVVTDIVQVTGDEQKNATPSTRCGVTRLSKLANTIGHERSRFATSPPFTYEQIMNFVSVSFPIPRIDDQLRT